MITIHKYDLPALDDVTIDMPRGAEILSIQSQMDEMRIWAKVDNCVPHEKRRFIIYGTGHPMAEYPLKKQSYIATVLLRRGLLVLHVFELIS